MIKLYLIGTIVTFIIVLVRDLWIDRWIQGFSDRDFLDRKSWIIHLFVCAVFWPAYWMYVVSDAIGFFRDPRGEDERGD